MDTLESLRRKIESAHEVSSIVRTMKAMAASNIGQYEMATAALTDYYHTIVLGLMAYLMNQKDKPVANAYPQNKNKTTCVIVFGSDQGLVGQFNEVLVQFTLREMKTLGAIKETWVIGGQAQEKLIESGVKPEKIFRVPNSVSGITSLVGQILMDIEAKRETDEISGFVTFHNRLQIGGSDYTQYVHHLLPIDIKMMQEIETRKWPTNKLPVIPGEIRSTYIALIREFLFVSLYRACAESLASENASRRAAMQRAKKNIDELLEDMNNSYHQLRQNSIDEELFDVVSGFEALK